MSFFAGNGKLHITNQERTLESMNTNTIYPDTVFHSNMQSLCSLGEYQSQAQPVSFQVNGQTEYCFEAEIPAAVRNHIADHKVVLVTMGNISTFINDTNPKEAPIAFPINIKAGTGGGIMGDNRSYSVVTSPQVTAGGLLDISYSVNAIANRNIVVSSVDEDGASNQHSPDNVNGWSADPDYSAGGKVTNLMRPNSRFMQYHARGLRRRLSDYSTSTVQASRPDTPYYLGLDGIMAPIFTFVVLNVRFAMDNTYQFINPLTYNNSEGIVLEGDNLSINGTKFNSVKILQSRNGAAEGSFVLGKYLNRMLPAVTYTNVSIDTIQTRQYKQWSMCNFMQGAKHANGLPAFMQCPGTYERVDCWGADNNSRVWIFDGVLKAHICSYGLFNGYGVEKDLLGYPMPGYPTSAYPTYRRRSDTLLFEEVLGVTGYHGYMTDKEPFALLDTSKFSSMYITKDGISGQYFDGSTTHTIPIWNNASPPTHMITDTKNLYFSARGLDVTLNTTTITVNQGGYYMGFNKTEESLLMGVRISNNIGTNLYRPSTTHYGGDDYYMACWENDALTGMYTADGVVHGLVKLKDGEEMVIAQMYVQGGSKWQEQGEVTTSGYGGPTFNKAVQIMSVGIFVMYTIKREGNSLSSYSRVKLDYDNYEEILNNGTLNAGDWTLSYLNIPRVDAYVVRIQ